MRAPFRDVWEALGRPPWYFWPLLVVPLVLSSWFLSYALIALALGIALIVLGELWLGVLFLVFVPICVFGAIHEHED